MKYRWMWLWLMVFSCLVLAGTGPGAVRKQIESTMLVTGVIDVEPDGHVSTYSLDQVDKLPPGIVQLVEGVVPAWTFEPVLVDGHSIRAQARMTLRIVAKKLEDQSYSIGIRSASFGKGEPGQSVRPDKMEAPTYPTIAAKSGVAGTVYVVLRIGRDGRVHDAFAEQVNLKIVASEREMDGWRGLLAHSALAAAKRWSFIPPTAGNSTDKEFWFTRVPVAYNLESARLPKYGQWETYVPGPRQVAPWLDHDDVAHMGVDAFVAGTVSQVGTGLRLLTPLGDG
jgi:hypothetical protein